MTTKTEALEALDKVRALSGGWAPENTVDRHAETVRAYIEAQAAEIERMEAEKRETMELLQRARAG